MKDYYKTLGVRRTASLKAITNAFRKQARQKHPDVGGSPDEFRELKEAYDCLSDPIRRQRYDETGTDPGAAPIHDVRFERVLLTVAYHLKMALDRIGDVKRADILSVMSRTMTETRSHLLNEVKNCKQSQDRYKEVSSRFECEEINFGDK